MKIAQVLQEMFSVCLIIVVSLPPQSSDRLPNKRIPGKQKASQVLGIEISTKGSQLCVGSSLAITLKVTNKSRSAIAINVSELWSFITFSAYTKKSSNSIETKSRVIVAPTKSHSADKYAILSPNQTLTDVKSIDTTDGFFKTINECDLSVSYQQLLRKNVDGVELWSGMIESNRVKLQVAECAKEQR